MKPHRMNRAEAEIWRRNRMLIREVGTKKEIRACTQEECAMYEKAAGNGETPIVRVGGVSCELISERTILAEKLLAEKGAVQLRWPNGIIARVIRDPKAIRPKYTTDVFTVPYPEQCDCREIGKPHPGRHHPLCTHNRRALPAHRALGGDYKDAIEPKVMDFPESVAQCEKPLRVGAGVKVVNSGPGMQRRPIPTVQQVVELPASAIPEPSACVCAGWGTFNPDPGRQHNSVCQHFQAWMDHHPLENVHVLVDIETDEVIRQATPEEIQKAGIDVASTVRVGGRSYLVIKRKADGDERAEAAPLANDETGDLNEETEPAVNVEQSSGAA